jgi:hypothetical protein
VGPSLPKTDPESIHENVLAVDCLFFSCRGNTFDRQQLVTSTLVDLAKDGKLDIITGKRYLAHEGDPGAYEPLGLYWYRWSPQEGHFIKHVIDHGAKAGGGIQIIAVDIYGDGGIDLVAPGKSRLFLFVHCGFSPGRRQNSVRLRHCQKS